MLIELSFLLLLRMIDEFFLLHCCLSLASLHKFKVLTVALWTEFLAPFISFPIDYGDTGGQGNDS